jgi:hypothetical protein
LIASSKNLWRWSIGIGTVPSIAIHPSSFTIDQFLPTALAVPGVFSVTYQAPKNISDLWIVPIFLDFWRLFELEATDLSSCKAVDYPVLPDVGMGVAKNERGVSTRRLGSQWNSPECRQN